MKDRQKLLTDEQREVNGSHASTAQSAGGWARTSAFSHRACFEGILWILQTGAAWRFLPDEFSFALDLLAAAQVVGGRRRVAQRLAGAAGGTGPRGLLSGTRICSTAASPRRKGALPSAKPKRGNGTKWMVLVDGNWSTVKGLPLGVRLVSASPSEVTLCGDHALAEVRVPRPKGRPRQKPKRVIADRGYDSDPLRQRLRRRGIELIVPYRENNQHRRCEDRRKLRRHKRRWIVERTNAWLGQFRACWFRHEHLLCTYRAFFYIACFWITLRTCF